MEDFCVTKFDFFSLFEQKTLETDQHNRCYKSGKKGKRKPLVKEDKTSITRNQYIKLLLKFYSVYMCIRELIVHVYFTQSTTFTILYTIKKCG